MNTIHKQNLKERHEAENKKFIILIRNEENVIIKEKGLNCKITSQYTSIEEALHKIELDLMTNLHFGFKNPIQIKIIEVLKE
jgi:hypothetical protein